MRALMMLLSCCAIVGHVRGSESPLEQQHHDFWALMHNDVTGGMGYVPEDNPSAVAVMDTDYTFWPNGIIYYDFVDPPHNKTVFDMAIADLQLKTCLRFKQRNGDTSIISYVAVATSRTGCNSAVGMYKKGATQMNLQAPGCWITKRTIIHEMLHAAGFQHEHQRFDRDDYVFINTANVQSDQMSNFDLIPRDRTYTVGIKPYDILSIMHYPYYAFGKVDPATGQTLQTIFVKGSDFKIPYEVEISGNDSAMVNEVYENCRGTVAAPTTTTTSKFGIVMVRSVLDFLSAVLSGVRSSLPLPE